MSSSLQKRYGLITAICMVVGIVIGSGVFFKAEKILAATQGNLSLGILAWILGGLIMIACAYTFAVMATKYQKVNGVVDYAEATVGPNYGYLVGWFLATIYFPTITGVVAWVAARYTCVLFGWSIVGPEAMIITLLYLTGSFALNAVAPVLAGKLQVSTTIIKMIPLFLMAIVGTIVGLSNGLLVENFNYVAQGDVVTPTKALLTAVVATAFAYEGWIIATSINSEIKDAKKNLPIALVLGTFVIMITYILYYIGLAGAVPNAVMMKGGEEGARIAFETIFMKGAGTGLFVLIVVSCLGTLNGLMVACTRGLYSIASRNKGPKAEVLKQIDKTTNMPHNSAIIGLFLAAFWTVYFVGSNLVATPWFGKFSFDGSELTIVTIYLLYLPIFVNIIRKEKDFNLMQRYVGPILSIIASLFMIYASYISHSETVLYYSVIFLIIMTVGYVLKDTSQVATRKVAKK